VAPAESPEANLTPKRAAVQAAVLQATEDLLRDGASYADLNIERIARRAGISRTAFYFYFRDKREVLMRLSANLSERLYREADVWFSGIGDPAGEMRRALSSVAAVYREQGVLVRAIVEVSAYDDEVARFWRALVERFIDATRTRIDSEREAGRSRAVPSQATAFALCWMTERAFYQQLVQEQPDVRDLVDALGGIWMRVVYG
jgi:TetR/AcrR family transcriptional regulator, ethionamide resistance regulator